MTDLQLVTDLRQQLVWGIQQADANIAEARDGELTYWQGYRAALASVLDEYVKWLEGELAKLDK